jgi:hypothetical protein
MTHRVMVYSCRHHTDEHANGTADYRQKPMPSGKLLIRILTPFLRWCESEGCRDDLCLWGL